LNERPEAPIFALPWSSYGRLSERTRQEADSDPSTKGTPFSQCVIGMAKLATGRASSPRAACQGLSTRHSDAKPGTHGSSYSQCLVGAAKLLRALHQSQS
jgi:hypothetical protein